MNKQALVEAVKEALRYAVFGAVALFVTYLYEKMAGMPQNDTVIVLLTLGLRMLDKYLHQQGKEEMPGRSGEPLGLLPF